MTGGASRATRDEVISLLFMALLFFAVLAGREIGSIYSSYREISQLAVVFYLDEEDIAGYIRDVLRGEVSDLEVGVALTLPSARGEERVITKLPDYARRWFISVILSPIVVRQPEVSDVEVTLWVEGEALQTERFGFDREKVPYITFLDRSVTLVIEDMRRFSETVTEASEEYGGEVKLVFTGQALVHLLFLNVWLPFQTIRYPLVMVPHVEYMSSRWTGLDGSPVTRLEAGSTTYVEFKASNPTRVHSIHENVTVSIYRQGAEGPVHTAWKIASVAPGTTATYVFQFTPEEAGVYFYSLEAVDGFRRAEGMSPSLVVEGG